jgi:hypothetical protein
MAKRYRLQFPQTEAEHRRQFRKWPQASRPERVVFIIASRILGDLIPSPEHFRPAYRRMARTRVRSLYQVPVRGAILAPILALVGAAPVHRRKRVVHISLGVLTDEYIHGGAIGASIGPLERAL